MLIIHGAGLLTAGLIISTIGVTRVFVPEDLAFMQTTADALRSANPRLVPLVAHDRATFGGHLGERGLRRPPAHLGPQRIDQFQAAVESHEAQAVQDEGAPQRAL